MLSKQSNGYGFQNLPVDSIIDSLNRLISNSPLATVTFKNAADTSWNWTFNVNNLANKEKIRIARLKMFSNLANSARYEVTYSFWTYNSNSLYLMLNHSFNLSNGTVVYIYWWAYALWGSVEFKITNNSQYFTHASIDFY